MQPANASLYLNVQVTAVDDSVDSQSVSGTSGTINAPVNDNKPKTNVGAIVGGVIGGLAGLGLCLCILGMMLSKRSRASPIVKGHQLQDTPNGVKVTVPGAHPGPSPAYGTSPPGYVHSDLTVTKDNQMASQI